MLAERADEVRGKLLAFVNVTADRADPAFLFFFLGLRLRFDVREIVRVGRGGSLIKDITVCHVRDKERVGADIDRFVNVAGNEAVAAIRDVDDPVLRAAEFNSGHFVGVASALEAEMLEGAELRGFAEDRDIEFPCFKDHVVGIISFVNGNRDAVGRAGHLCYRVDNAAIVLVAVACGADEQTVAQIAHDKIIHGEFLLFYLENENARVDAVFLQTENAASPLLR